MPAQTRARLPLLALLIMTCLAAGHVAAWAASMTVRASVDTEGGDPNNFSFNPSISANGGQVAFDSYASDLVPGDGNGTLDVFVRGPLPFTASIAPPRRPSET